MSWTTWMYLLLGAGVAFAAYRLGQRSTGRNASAPGTPAIERLPPNPVQKPSATTAPPPAAAGDSHPAAGQPMRPRPPALSAPPAIAEVAAAPQVFAPGPQTRRPPAAAGGVSPVATADRSASDTARSPRSPAATTAPVKPGINPAAGAPAARTAPALARPATAFAVHKWGYQLQKLNIARAADSPFDLIVVDYAKDGSDDTRLTSAELARLKRMPNGSRRRVLAYLSIGEAESYRSYWDASWNHAKPGWLLGENPEWKENYAVCFWNPEWQRIMCGGPAARLDLILAAGFDGIYLDKCDVFEDLQRRYKHEAATRPDIEADMIAFIVHLAGYARQNQPDFLVVMQNAEGLLEQAALRRVLDGAAKEELVFGIAAPEKRNSAADIEYSRRCLDLMQAEGKLVLVVEYLDKQAKIDEAVREIAPLGYVLYIAPKNRELDRLNYEIHEA